MKNEDSKIYAKKFFESVDYSVELIPESEDRRADLKATFGEETLIVEAKGKAPNRRYFDLLEQVRQNGIGQITRQEIAWNALSSLVEEASSQLEKTPSDDNSPRVLFVSCLHGDWKYVFEAFRHRLYGDVDLIVVKEEGGFPQVLPPHRCFYYNGSDFFRYRIIDAVILGGPTGIELLVNEFGCRVNQFRLSYLYSKMKEHNAVCDPKLLCESGIALSIADQLLKDQDSKWKYLLDKYGFKTSVMSNYSYKALVSVPLK